MTIDSISSEHRSQAQKLKYLFLASVSLALGAWLCVRIIQADFFLFRGRRFGWWDLSDTLLRATLVIYLVSWGAATLRRSGEAAATATFGWGKFLLGFTLIYASIKAIFVPQDSFFSPERGAQTAGFDSVTIIMCLIGAAFILAAFLKKPPRMPGRGNKQLHS